MTHTEKREPESSEPARAGATPAFSTLKTECNFCLVMWIEDVKLWTPHDRMTYTAHLKLHHGWVWRIEP